MEADSRLAVRLAEPCRFLRCWLALVLLALWLEVEEDEGRSSLLPTPGAVCDSYRPGSVMEAEADWLFKLLFVEDDEWMSSCL